MQRMKSIFISFYLMTVFLFLIINIQKFIENEFHWVWLPGIVSQVVPLIFIAKLFLVKTARTHSKLPVWSILQMVLFVVVVFNMDSDEPLLKQPIIYSIFSVAGWFVYFYWYSVLPKREIKHLRVGGKIPNLEFVDMNGQTIGTDEYLGTKVLFMFFRGNWCPLCMAQINEISEQYQELADRNVRIVLISPQVQNHSIKLARKFSVPFVFLTDPKNSVAQKINIAHKSGTPMGMEVFGYSSDTVLPTIVITDESGKICFIDQTDNYRVRPEPAIFLKILDEIDR